MPHSTHTRVRWTGSLDFPPNSIFSNDKGTSGSCSLTLDDGKLFGACLGFGQDEQIGGLVGIHLDGPRQTDGGGLLRVDGGSGREDVVNAAVGRGPQGLPWAACDLGPAKELLVHEVEGPEHVARDLVEEPVGALAVGGQSEDGAF